jgi:ABC-2 type transport system permease protein
VLTPVAMLLLFVYVFGGAMATDVAGPSYVDYVVPGILIMTVGSGCAATAVGINADMTEGIIARFRTKPISRAAVLTGRVLGSMLRTATSMVLVVGISLLAGFRPTTAAVDQIAAIAFIAVLIFALTWLAVALGMAAASPEGANSSTLLLQFGPFISSAFVPPDTMPAGVRGSPRINPLPP